jgi:hypothetical protein
MPMRACGELLGVSILSRARAGATVGAMDASGLPRRSREALASLEAGIMRVLEQPSPHERAVGSAAIPPGGNAYGSPFYGGRLLARPMDTPPFTYDREDMSRLFRAVIGEAPGLRRVIVHAARESTSAAWSLRHKVVTGAEVDALAKRRTALDKKVKAELARLQTDDGRTLVFGRRAHGDRPELSRNLTRGFESLPPPPALLELFTETERLYHEAGHELVVATWTLDVNRFAFSDHFE